MGSGRISARLGAVPAPPLDPLLGVLDAARGAVLRRTGAFGKAWIAPRERRVALLGACLVGLALALACTRPLWLLALGPLALGVPHVIADLRYLVARPGYHRRAWLLLPAALGLSGALLGFGVRAGLVAAATALLVSHGKMARRALGVALLSGLALVAHQNPWLADLVFAHAHNLVAVAFFWAWRRRSGRLHLVPIGLFALGSALILSGGAAPILEASGGLESPFRGLSLRGLGAALGPSGDPALAGRFVLFYAFAQSVHYAVWMRLVPEEDRPRGAPRSFRQSFKALESDLGPFVLWGAALATLGIAAYALLGVARARDTYLHIAFFHAHLELVAGALLFAEGMPPREG